MHGGFKVWLLNGYGPNLCFPKVLGKVPDFHGKNLATCHLTFMAEIRHCFALGDMDCDNHTERGEQVYIYVHHAQCKCTEQESKQGSPYSRDEDKWYTA